MRALCCVRWTAFVRRDDPELTNAAPTRREAAALLASAGAWLASARARAQEPTPAPSDIPTTRVDTGVTTSDHITAPVMIDGQGPFQFLVDTGANRSCVRREVAELLGLPAGRPAPVNTVVGKRMQRSVRIDRLQVGGRTQRGVTAPVLSIPEMEVDGVLGVDWLKGQRLTLDIRGRRLEIGRSRRDVSGPNTVVVPARRRSSQLTMVDADVGGRPISAIIDTGSQVTMMNAALRPEAERVRRKDRPGPELVALLSVVGERFTGHLYHLPFMRVGGITFGNAPVVFADAHVFDIWNLKTRPAVLLGIDLLREFESVTLDFGRASVRFDFA